MSRTMEDFIKQAEQSGKWLHCNYQDLWFSPAELREEQSRGKFRWGAGNWDLRDPIEELEALELKVTQAIEQLSRFRRRMGVKP